jgi:cell division protein FtsL
VQPRSRQLRTSARMESSANVTSAIGMAESVGNLRARRNSLYTRTVLWITGVVCAALLLGTIAQAWSNSQLNGQLQTEQQKLQTLQRKNKQLANEVDYYKDPLVIEREAREKLGYARPGEQVVMVVGSGNKTQPQTPTQAQQQAQYGFWQDWWRIFFGG